jgi:uncharacterized membrane protein YdjX (TVP38/TMEM64 family)
MEELWSLLLIVFESGSWYAPAIFILFHVIRQFLFIPPAVVCIAGGLLFGMVPGILYSLIGLTGASIFFYLLMKQAPAAEGKLRRIKHRLVGRYRDLTIAQVMLLRLIPVIHYHLLSFCLYERNRSFKVFVRASFLANIPFTIFYTLFGEYIGHFNAITGALLTTAILLFTYLVREKIAFIKWREFFNSTT